MSKVPAGWHIQPLAAIATITSGGTPSRNNLTYWNGNIPWVTTAEVHFNEIKDSKEKITKLGLDNSSAKIFPSGTLLMAMYGQGKTRGQVAKLKIDASTNQACAAILLKNGFCADYYYLYLESQYKNIRDMSNSGGQKNLSGGLIKSLLVPVPPLPEQTKIAQILSTWDKAIATNEKLIGNSQQQKKALMQSLLTGKKRLPGFEGEWLKIRLGDVFEKVTNGLTYDSTATTGLPVSRIETISTGKVNYSKVGWAPDEINTRRFKLQWGDILYSHINSLEHIGRVAFFQNESELYHGMNLLLLRANNRVIHEFIFHTLNSFIGKKYAKTFAKSAVNQASISTTDLKSFTIKLPPLPEQQKIAAVLTAADNEIELLQKKLAFLKQEKAALMQQLLTGKRRVKVEAA